MTPLQRAIKFMTDLINLKARYIGLTKVDFANWPPLTKAVGPLRETGIANCIAVLKQVEQLPDEEQETFWSKFESNRGVTHFDGLVTKAKSLSDKDLQQIASEYVEEGTQAVVESIQEAAEESAEAVEENAENAAEHVEEAVEAVEESAEAVEENAENAVEHVEEAAMEVEQSGNL
jgi:uncharacterized protein YPO0396